MEHIDYPHNAGMLDSCNACTDGPCTCCDNSSDACWSDQCTHRTEEEDQ